MEKATYLLFITVQYNIILILIVVIEESCERLSDLHVLLKSSRAIGLTRDGGWYVW